MELSELVRWRGHLYGVCDYTGVVFKIDPSIPAAFPRYKLATGDGNRERPHKSEWATVKDGALYVGSFGMEWLSSNGSIEHRDMEWVKVILPTGGVRNSNWNRLFTALRRAVGATHPRGYIFHEAVHWHPERRQWLILPRKLSTSHIYNPLVDETKGTNILFLVEEDWSAFEIRTVSDRDPEWGFSVCCYSSSVVFFFSCLFIALFLFFSLSFLLVLRIFFLYYLGHYFLI